MMKKRPNGEALRAYLLTHVGAHPADIATRTAEHFEITRQAVNRQLRQLIEDGMMVGEGNTRSKRYKLKTLGSWTCVFPIDGQTAEDWVWRQHIKPQLGEMPVNVRDIWHYGFTEMFNNAMEHSEGTSVFVSIEKTAVSVELAIIDNGIGIFKKISAALGLRDERHAVLELAKGKMTTAPEAHSGEGIFFTSKVFDRFGIESGEVSFVHDPQSDEDWLLEREISGSPEQGTTVLMSLSTYSTQELKTIFAQYQDDDWAFSRTVVPVRLARLGDDQLISRSQAKRVLSRVEKFKTVIFDFSDVDRIGQAFADEVFRVFAKAHPEMSISYVHASEEVEAMIARARHVVL